MELKEINVPDGIVRHIDHEGQFAVITVDSVNGNNMGSVPVSMTSLSKKVLINNWSSQKMAEEINLERTRYLLNTDKMLEEWHSCTERK